MFTVSGLYDLRKDKPYVTVTSPGSPEHLASNPSRILRASKSVTGPNSLYVGGKIQVTTVNQIFRRPSTDIVGFLFLMCFRSS